MTNTVKCPSGEPIEVDPWISVKDRLPDENCDILIFRDIGNIGRVEPDVADNDFFKYYERNEITHWMPLPKPPKTDK